MNTSATFLKGWCKWAYAINACVIPKMEASITTHFQQYVLFIFIVLFKV
jgi:hypothetical protein